VVNRWDYRISNLDPVAGKTISQIRLYTDGTTQPDQWDLYFQDFVFTGADGTVQPLFSQNATVPSLTGFGSTGMTQTSATIHDCVGSGCAPINTTTYYHGDQIGSSRLLTNGNGYPVWQGTFLPYGEEYTTQITTNHYKFTEKERDSESGLDYFGGRYYSSVLGRWVSADWSATPVPVPYADFFDPQTLNLYGYVRNLPTSKIDADGHGDAMTHYWQCQGRSSPDCRAANHQSTVKEALVETGIMGAWFGSALLAPAAGSALLIRLAPLMTAAGQALIRARDAVANAVQELKSANLSTSAVTNSRISSAINALKDHASDMDLKGVVREAAGVLKGNHAQEVGEVVDSLKNLKSSLEGALNNPNLSDEAWTTYTQTIEAINNFVAEAQPVVDAAKAAQGKK